jgi:tetratricopeptide (TPR) repeat protein
MEEMAGDFEEPLEFIRFVIEDLELPAENRISLYRLAVETAKELSGSEAGGDEDDYTAYEYGYGSGSGAAMLRYWLEQAFQFAIDNGRHEEALEWIDSYEAHGFVEQLWGFMRRDGRFWQLKARALLAAGRREGALEALEGVWRTDSPRLDRYQIAHRILLEAGEREAAEDLMIGYYRDALGSGRADAGTYTGLAAILLDRSGRASEPVEAERLTQEALSYLDRMVNRLANNSEGMSRAASLLERRELYSSAVGYRKMLRRLSPLDHENMLALAVDERALGNSAEAIDLLRDLLTGGEAPSEIRQKALEPYIELFEESSADAGEEMKLFEESKDLTQIDSLVYAELARVAGHSELFRESIDSGLDTFLEPSLLEKRRAEIEADAGNAEAAVDFLRRSLRSDPRPDARLALLEALLDSGRNGEALQLLDYFEYIGLHARDLDELGRLLGIGGADLLEILNRLVSAALDARLYDAAHTYESRRVELAGILKIETEDRREEINELKKKSALEEPPLRIVDRIAN